jgi:hypothetical protein
MTRHDIDRDAEFVRKIAETYRPTAPTPAQRVAFRAGVDARIARRVSARRWLAGAAAAACALGLLWLRSSPTAGPTSTPAAAIAEIDATEALLALAEPATSESEALPADYQAIGDLLLEGEGV